MSTRNERRLRKKAMKKDRFVAKCAMCETEHCEVHVLGRRAKYADDPTAPEDLGICKGCPCAHGTCDACGETGQHWLGSAAVGLPPGGDFTVLH